MEAMVGLKKSMIVNRFPTLHQSQVYLLWEKRAVEHELSLSILILDIDEVNHNVLTKHPQQIEMHDERNVNHVENHPSGLAEAEQVVSVEESRRIVVTNGNFYYKFTGKQPK
jgi:hypothetical protein